MFYRWLFTALFVAIWAGWAAFWIAMARRAKEAAQFESAASRLSHVGPLLIAAYLLAAPAPLPIPALHGRFVPLTIWPAALGAVLGFAGLAFCVWARVTIAANWSSDVQLKRGHELIVAGPYALVRHPIYTGLIMMFAGTALAVGEWRAALASSSRRRRFGASCGARRRSCAVSSAWPTPDTRRACRRLSRSSGESVWLPPQ